MPTFKVVIGLKDGKCAQKEVQDPDAKQLLGKVIGDTIPGEVLSLAGYEFEITGGSDYCGFPMRKDIPGAVRKRILEIKGIGVKSKGRGIRVRKTVCGNMVHPKTAQINVKVTKEGKDKIEVAAKKEEEKK
ncbi:MAG: 30S ribosomal protein S6e [Candidatus Woesearchaeota archaeon]|jgi:small subunit ribosomal protein S6e|nr:30S ribosomal protein S6e [Candidatus Woesearchaeota archaeon]MDP7181206.1 30S ribosomal protein S6e [Candidatus Woesearchaeota archaeon]MDP7198174.1 30S ribosomal protein S6e [Candidatus Woesearchaeota archaeon]MDP7467009.1 30S ribosomal protein S6e [Candidatus Woesearchaeota archaeon]MDP7646679.1 30S ribosomal protein S6e [Candidatus Woesearchaeota archaeon]